MLASLRSLRRFVPPETEYAVRRGALRLLPLRHRSSFDQVYHCCVWKTASQWVRLILSDPRIYRYSGLLPVPTESDDQAMGAGYIFSPVYCDFDDYTRRARGMRSSAFFVIRDPRDIMVSWYFSTRYSHRPNPIVDAKRQILSQCSEQEGLLITARDFSNEILPLIDSWLGAFNNGENVKIIRYEDLTGPEQMRYWSDILHHCDIAVPDDVLAGVLETYSFDRLTGGRSKGSESKTDKYRKGVPGDWKNHFSDEVSAEFIRWNGDVTQRAGYGGDA